MRSIMLGRPDLSELLPRNTAPTLLVTGDDDPMWTAAGATAAAGELLHGQAATVAGSRHLPSLEAPDEIIALITDFWSASSSDSTFRSVSSKPDGHAPQT